MKLFKFYPLLAIALLSASSCNERKANEKVYVSTVGTFTEPQRSNGYWENGQIITSWDCPDDLGFPATDINVWNKTPVVNGRFPTYKEVNDGLAIHHYNQREHPGVKLYPMTFPKLAYFVNPNKWKPMGVDNAGKLIQAHCTDTVIVIQAVQLGQDTIVGFRYLSGGVGGSLYRDFHFLTDNEVKALVAN